MSSDKDHENRALIAHAIKLIENIVGVVTLSTNTHDLIADLLGAINALREDIVLLTMSGSLPKRIKKHFIFLYVLGIINLVMWFLFMALLFLVSKG